MIGAESFHDRNDRQRWALTALAMSVFAAYIAVATMATLIIPQAFVIFIAPFLLLSIASMPQQRAVSKKIIAPLLVIAAALMPLWPAYLHLKLGPAPILTPPRLIFYIITAFWLYDMAASPLRRGQFATALKRSPLLAGLVFAFFALNAISVPIAEGSVPAGKEFFRQVIIWFLPFCAFVTYVRTFREFRRLLIVTVVAAGIAGLIAMSEVGAGVLLVTKLSPLIGSEAEWLRIAQDVKSRDGFFRAQATHTHPLSLGEFLSMSAPLALVFGVSARGLRRCFWAVVFVVILGGIIATNARGPLLAMAAGLGVAGIIMTIRILRDNRLFRLRPFIGLAAIFLVVASPAVIIAGQKIIAGEVGTSAARSSKARLDQIEMAWPKIAKRPIGGYGTGRSAILIGYWGRTLSVDNYYLSLAVETGIPGSLVFISIMIITAKTSLGRAKTAPRRWGWMLIGFAGAMVAFMTTRSILSQTGNLSYFFPLIGAFIGASAHFRPKRIFRRRERPDWA